MTTTIYADWGGHHVKLTWLPGADHPDAALVTSIHGVCMDQGKMMLVHVTGRGFNLPGGHVEDGETAEETLLRECMEEGYVRCEDPHLIGAIQVSHEDNPRFDPSGKYPLIGYQLFYRVRVAVCLPYLGEHECTARIWVEPELASRVMEDHNLAHLIVEEAVRKADAST
ncbi:NUDIX domain-containing protein [Paenibacillus sp. 1011MAR3C5]|uniref:NUDIX domain-containing protein n=1 Tax=Paenibacillus sp. 1011MAR3C5 TaxID=1675787 RepID=UPI000E6C3CBE|nr:NUDIX domain-containing protein [Paenibacillus sp. 1011MAR3C5]RJE86233.1 NUDIX domain-containing protein [Paenibacillus sp. 1011MAR3C5]